MESFHYNIFEKDQLTSLFSEWQKDIDILSETIDIDCCQIFYYKKNTPTIVISNSSCNIKPNKSFYSHINKKSEVTIIEDAGKETDLPGFISFFPLQVIKNNYAYLCLLNSQPKKLDKKQLNLINHFVRLFEKDIEKEIKSIPPKTIDQINKKSINYELLYENSGTLNCFFDTECKLIGYNKVFEHFFGEYITVLKTHKGEVKFPEYFKTLIKRLKKGLNSGRKETYTTHYIIDAFDVWFEENYIPIKDKDYNILGIQIILIERTKLVKIEGEIKKQEDFIKKAQHLGGFGYWEMDLANHQILCSEETFEIFNLKKNKKLTLDKVLSLVKKKDAKGFLFELEESQKSKTPISMEIPIKIDGHLKHIYLNAELLFNNKKKASHVFGTVQDITEKTEAKRNIASSERRYRKLFEMLSDPTFLIDKETGRVLEINSAVTEIYGTTRDEALKLRNTDFSAEPDHTRKALINKTNKVPLRWHKKKDGTIFPVEITASNFNWKGDDVQIAVCRDISERMESEKSLRYFERIYSLSANPIMIVDIEGNIMQSNPAFLSILGYKQNEVEGKNIAQFIHPDDLNRTFEYISEQIEKKANVLSFENRYTSKDGSYVWFSWKTQPIYDEGISFSIAHDITHLKKVEEELTIAKNKAEESDFLKTSFLCNMSHEIRTPMNGILGFSDILTQPNVSAKKRKYFAEIITQSCGRLLNIINDIIDISKIETGQIEYALGEFDIIDEMQNIKSFYQNKAKESNIQLRMLIPNNLNTLKLKSDKLKIRQVLDNLITNAFKFTNQGFIEFGFTLKNNIICFKVVDSGVGIPKEFHSSIFERFTQVDKNMERKKNGTGLGLAISKAFITDLGGEIGFSSVLNKGSEFYFTLPINS